MTPAWLHELGAHLAVAPGKLISEPTSNKPGTLPLINEHARSSASSSPTPTQMTSSSHNEPNEPEECLPSDSELPVQTFLVDRPRDLFSSTEGSFGFDDVLSLLEDPPIMFEPESPPTGLEKTDGVRAAPTNIGASSPLQPPKSAPKRRQPGGGAIPRYRYTSQQKQVLDKFFQQVQLPSRRARIALAQTLNVTPQQIKVWFRNMRQRLRLKDGKEF